MPSRYGGNGLYSSTGDINTGCLAEVCNEHNFEKGPERGRTLEGRGGGVKKGDGLFLLLVSLFILFSHYENHRFFKHNCPVCQDLTVNLENEHNALVWLLETCTNKSNLTLGDEFNRSLQFKHLSIFGWFSFLFKCFYRDLFGILAFQQL